MEELKICPIDNTYKIAESTLLIREAFDYVATKRQLDLIYVIISMIGKNDDEFKTYNISFDKIAQIYNPKNPRTKEIKKYVDEATNKIMDSHFQITEDGIIKKYHWVECCEINPKTETVVFKLSDKVKKFYIQLKENSYTVYLLKDLLALSTLFQSNLFRWLSCNSNFKNKVKINIEDAKRIFYGNEIETKTFIRKIDAALDVIRRKTNIDATYCKVKNGKVITALEFYIDNNYGVDFSLHPTKSDEQYMKEAKRRREMWKENIDMKNKIAEMEKEMEEMKAKLNDENKVTE